ncbi:MmcQ/YjbR family DNA-binding protein [Paenibacillus puerhi]|uniref:MmcQ/YjbR family DNA-binding protein n=1 Tax=Paenibacillus puerhi TaxID=2692622 RepID=UPI00135CE9CF|nr:MmcQ/YjbR family DNA-binding protein [Paenibacillus puerhi]
MISINEVQEYILSLPESKEVSHWGKSSYRINNKIFAVLQEDGITLTIKTIEEDRTIYTTMDSETYAIPESFSNMKYMHVNLNTVEPEEIKGLLLKAWGSIAPKKLVKAYGESRHDEGRGIT